MSGDDQELARDLGFLEAYTIGLGTMIGAGIFVLPSIVADQAGPASMVSFLVGGMVSLLATISLSELATGMPRAGGSYYYVNRALGPFFGSIVGWGMWAGLTFASAFYMIGFGQYLLPGLGRQIHRSTSRMAGGQIPLGIFAEYTDDAPDQYGSSNRSSAAGSSKNYSSGMGRTPPTILPRRHPTHDFCVDSGPQGSSR